MSAKPLDQPPRSRLSRTIIAAGVVCGSVLSYGCYWLADVIARLPKPIPQGKFPPITHGESIGSGGLLFCIPFVFATAVSCAVKIAQRKRNAADGYTPPPPPPRTPVRWPQNKFAWITATLGAGFMPVLLLVNSLTNGPPMRLPGDLIGVIFFGAVGGVIGGAFGNWWCGRR